MIVVMVGNPLDGVLLYGPFDDHETALAWAEAENPPSTWWTVVVEPMNPN